MRDCPSRGAPDDGFLFWPSTGLLGDDQRCKRDKLFLARPVPHRPVIILKPEPHRTVMASCLSATACRVCCIVQGSGHDVRFLWFIHDIVPPSALHRAALANRKRRDSSRPATLSSTSSSLGGKVYAQVSSANTTGARPSYSAIVQSMLMSRSAAFRSLGSASLPSSPSPPKTAAPHLSQNRPAPSSSSEAPLVV